MSNKKTIYFDYAATTPVDREVVAAMTPFWSEAYGNPSSLYQLGLRSRQAVEQSRKTIASILHTKPEEIIFTAGGTESVNLAILGVVHSALHRGIKTPHVVTSAIEHPAVLECIDALIREKKITATKILPNREGSIDVKQITEALTPKTILVSIMYANNEIGTIEPIAGIAHAIKKYNQSHRTNILFHTDACQALGLLDVNIQRLGVDLLSGNASKMYGPKQSGFLYVRKGIELTPIMYGGGQEKNLRSGTENVPAIVGLGKAFALAEKNKTRTTKSLAALQAYALKKILTVSKDVQLNGPKLGKTRLVNNLNLYFPGIEGEPLVLYLDSHGIAASTGSACSTGSTDPSHVLTSIGQTPTQAKEALRITLGKQTTKGEIDSLVKILPNLITKLKGVNKLNS